MNAVLSIEIELLEPAHVGSEEALLQLHPSQVRWVSIWLTAQEEGEARSQPVRFTGSSDDTRLAMQNLVSLAKKSQPNGTAVQIWFQGRSESFHI